MATFAPAPAARPLEFVLAPFAALVRAIDTVRDAAALSREAERLYALTDDQLAAQGLTREAVAETLFAQFFSK